MFKMCINILVMSVVPFLESHFVMNMFFMLLLCKCYVKKKKEDISLLTSNYFKEPKSCSQLQRMAYTAAQSQMDHTIESPHML